MVLERKNYDLVASAGRVFAIGEHYDKIPITKKIKVEILPSRTKDKTVTITYRKSKFIINYDYYMILPKVKKLSKLNEIEKKIVGNKIKEDTIIAGINPDILKDAMEIINILIGHEGELNFDDFYAYVPEIIAPYLFICKLDTRYFVLVAPRIIGYGRCKR